MRKILGVSLLVLLLTGSADAGLMPNGSPQPTPTSQPLSADPEPTDGAQDTASSGEISNAATDTLTQTTLDMYTLLSSLL
jgi:hypothetical protein